ncbi:rhodanese domain-containing protein CG4456 isoform X3 [Anopheles bellator]|uniref:rhodanese domain-containing protein CG4456 isoform X3 n=1 Tax=Anopheles bellator TaxID=139047 RepID=UPI0026472103|nr:rhodanese domain-containing protein CG4456 isoform X3 [Anopheles bellator]
MVLKTCGTNIVRNVGQLWVRFSILRQPRASKVSTVRSFAGVVQNTNHPGNQSIDRRRASTSLFAEQLLSNGRFESTGPANSRMSIATYEEVLDLPNHPEKLLIDVRNPDELAETGQIPTSINIPLPQLEEGLKLGEAEFKAKFGRDKPVPGAEIIFHCKMGGRAQRAADLAGSLGFSNARNYKGSWTEWAAKQGM